MMPPVSPMASDYREALPGLSVITAVSPEARVHLLDVLDELNDGMRIGFETGRSRAEASCPPEARPAVGYVPGWMPDENQETDEAIEYIRGFFHSQGYFPPKPDKDDPSDVCLENVVGSNVNAPPDKPVVIDIGGPVSDEELSKRRFVEKPPEPLSVPGIESNELSDLSEVDVSGIVNYVKRDDDQDAEMPIDEDAISDMVEDNLMQEDVSAENTSDAEDAAISDDDAEEDIWDVLDSEKEEAVVGESVDESVNTSDIDDPCDTGSSVEDVSSENIEPPVMDAETDSEVDSESGLSTDVEEAGDAEEAGDTQEDEISESASGDFELVSPPINDPSDAVIAETEPSVPLPFNDDPDSRQGNLPGLSEVQDAQVAADTHADSLEDAEKSESIEISPADDMTHQADAESPNDDMAAQDDTSADMADISADDPVREIDDVSDTSGDIEADVSSVEKPELPVFDSLDEDVYSTESEWEDDDEQIEEDDYSGVNVFLSSQKQESAQEEMPDPVLPKADSEHSEPDFESDDVDNGAVSEASENLSESFSENDAKIAPDASAESPPITDETDKPEHFDDIDTGVQAPVEADVNTDAPPSSDLSDTEINTETDTGIDMEMNADVVAPEEDSVQDLRTEDQEDAVSDEDMVDTDSVQDDLDESSYFETEQDDMASNDANEPKSGGSGAMGAVMKMLILGIAGVVFIGGGYFAYKAGMIPGFSPYADTPIERPMDGILFDEPVDIVPPLPEGVPAPDVSADMDLSLSELESDLLPAEIDPALNDALGAEVVSLEGVDADLKAMEDAEIDALFLEDETGDVESPVVDPETVESTAASETDVETPAMTDEQVESVLVLSERVEDIALAMETLASQQDVLLASISGLSQKIELIQAGHDPASVPREALDSTPVIQPESEPLSEDQMVEEAVEDVPQDVSLQVTLSKWEAYDFIGIAKSLEEGVFIRRLSDNALFTHPTPSSTFDNISDAQVFRVYSTGVLLLDGRYIGAKPGPEIVSAWQATTGATAVLTSSMATPAGVIVTPATEAVPSPDLPIPDLQTENLRTIMRKWRYLGNYRADDSAEIHYLQAPDQGVHQVMVGDYVPNAGVFHGVNQSGQALIDEDWLIAPSSNSHLRAR